jgi:hypothetical protein
MRIDLDATEAHWLRYCLVTGIAKLPQDDTEIRAVYQGILDKLSDTPTYQILPSSTTFRVLEREEGNYDSSQDSAQ